MRTSRIVCRSWRGVKCGSGTGRGGGDAGGGTRTKLPRSLSNQVSLPIGQPMRTRHCLVLSLASAAISLAPSLAGAQRTVIRSCGDRYSTGYVDCRYEMERSRAVERDAMRERADARRERTRWDAIVREARARARSYDLAESSRQRAAERAARSREMRDQRVEQARERREMVIRERSYRVRR